MKVAILFSGLVRTLPQVWPRIKAIYERYDPDIYCHMSEPDKVGIAQELFDADISVEKDQTFPEKDYAIRLGPGVVRDGVHSTGIQNHLRQLYGLMRVNQLRKSMSIDYDWIVRLRTDIEFIRDPEPLESLDLNFLYIPKFCNWGGYNDRFAFGAPKLMDIYMERFDCLDDYFNGGGVFHAETFLAWQLNRNCVPIARTNTMFNILRTNGDRDPVYWGPDWGDVY